MAKIQIKSETRKDLSFFPSSFDNYIPKDDKVRMLDSIVRSMDSKPLLSTYEGTGAPPYSPMMLLSLIIYSYINGVYSCRGIASCLRYDIRYMWICGGQRQSYSTINRFRTNHLLKCIDFYFDKVVNILVKKGVITLEEQYVDGTKIESKANKYTFVWRKSVERNRAKLMDKVRILLEQVDETIAQENTLKDTPVEFTPATLSQIVDELKDALEHEPGPNAKEQKKAHREKKRQIKELEALGDKLAEYEKHLEILGDRNSYSKTDPDATFMRMKEDAMNNGQTKPGYNLQIATENQFITDFAFFPNPTDTLTLIPFFNSFPERYNRLPGTGVADAGYGSEENYNLLKNKKIKPYVKYNYFRKDQKSGQITTSQNNPKLAKIREKAFKLLNTKKGIKLRKQRCHDVEPVFAELKHNKNFKRFMLRGKTKVEVEIGILAIAHNLKKMAKAA